MLLGVDTGGTFTDFVWFDGNRLRVHKVLSTPEAPEKAILNGIEALGLIGQAFFLVHGSTVATNAVLEARGVRTVYITNRGLGDVLSIGRQTRRELYNLQPQIPRVPVAREWCLETGGRVDANGEVIDPLDDKDIHKLLQQIEQLKPQAVAINLLFSYLDDHFERKIEDALPDDLFISRSSDILPQQKEYERGIATWLNAWVGPLVEGYLCRLQASISPAPVHVMQSSALTIRADLAARRAVNLLLSGPAGGLMGALRIGQEIGRQQLLSFDMGGTSTDVALLDGGVSMTLEGTIGDWPVAVPMVNMHTIGAGGGSIARVDDGGMLVVGPESAGAQPGPVCYGQGGTQVTVTDANLILGRLRPEAFLGGELKLNQPAANNALCKLAETMKLTPIQAAQGVIDIANEHMAQALRVISVQRGIDPRDYTLTAFGGAGGLHVCALADALDIRQALVPVYAGVLSALGMLAAPRGRQLGHALGGLLGKQDETGMQRHFKRLIDQGLAELSEEGVELNTVETMVSVDLRYPGQSYSLNIPYTDMQKTTDIFHKEHHKRYGHRLDRDPELVNVRVTLTAAGSDFTLQREACAVATQADEWVSMDGYQQPVPVWKRDHLQAGTNYSGPMLVIDPISTTWVAPGWFASRHESGCLLLERN